MNVLIITDLEGVSGITDWDAHECGTGQDQWQRQLMTGEVNAVVTTVGARPSTWPAKTVSNRLLPGKAT